MYCTYCTSYNILYIFLNIVQYWPILYIFFQYCTTYASMVHISQYCSYILVLYNICQYCTTYAGIVRSFLSEKQAAAVSIQCLLLLFSACCFNAASKPDSPTTLCICNNHLFIEHPPGGAAGGAAPVHPRGRLLHHSQQGGLSMWPRFWGRVQACWRRFASQPRGTKWWLKIKIF